jgi:hypothetical protein
MPTLTPFAHLGHRLLPAASAARRPPHGLRLLALAPRRLSRPPRWPLQPGAYRCHLPVSGRSPALAPQPPDALLTASAARLWRLAARPGGRSYLAPTTATYQSLAGRLEKDFEVRI